MIQGIKNIIFDLGGVILDIHYHKTVEAFNKLGIQDFEYEFSQATQSNFFENFEKGWISEEEFYNYLIPKCQPGTTTTQIKDAWNAMLGLLPLRRLQILQQLQLHYHTLLLSNTNSIHETAFHQILKEVCGYQSFSVFFDKIYYSHHIHMRKPDHEIFVKVLDDNSLIPNETLYIEDSIQHILTAQSLGIQTIHLQNGMTIEKDIFKSKTTP